MKDSIEISRSECESMCNLIEFNLFNDLRRDEEADNMTWLVNIINVFQRMAECCDYVGYSYNAKEKLSGKDSLTEEN